MSCYNFPCFSQESSNQCYDKYAIKQVLNVGSMKHVYCSLEDPHGTMYIYFQVCLPCFRPWHSSSTCKTSCPSRSSSTCSSSGDPSLPHSFSPLSSVSPGQESSPHGLEGTKNSIYVTVVSKSLFLVVQ